MSFIQLFALSPAEVAEGPASLKEKRNMEERQQKEDSGVVGRSRQQAPLQDEGGLSPGEASWGSSGAVLGYRVPRRTTTHPCLLIATCAAQAEQPCMTISLDLCPLDMA